MINDNANANAQHNQQPQNMQISAKEFSSKFRSKRECYNWLAGDCNVYLPPYGESRPLLSLTHRL